MTDALLTEAAHHLFNKFPEADKKVMTEALDSVARDMLQFPILRKVTGGYGQASVAVTYQCLSRLSILARLTAVLSLLQT